MASSELPEEIVTIILKKVPVKDLLRFKTVCKSWKSITSNPQFIQSHLHSALISAQKKPTLLTLEKNPVVSNNDSFVGHTIVNLQTLVNIVLRSHNYKRLEISASPVCFAYHIMPKIFSKCRVFGSYNGIICLADDVVGTDIYLWNPSIKQYKKLPVPNRYLYFPDLGFAFDSVSNDYKVLRFVVKVPTNGVPFPVVQIYSSNSDSWTEFLFPTITDWRRPTPGNVVVDGVMYFDGEVSFDLREQVFGFVPAPGFATKRMSEFLDFEGSVAVIFECSGDDQGVYLCTLNNVSGIWTKRFSVEADLSLDFYVGAGQFYGRKLDNDVYHKCLYTTVYDYKKKEAYYYEPSVPVNKIRGVLKYTESLVSIKGFEKIE